MPALQRLATETGSFLMGLAPAVPTGSLAFGTDDTDVTDSDTYLGTEIQRKIISWTFNGNTPRGIVSLSQSEANGSSIQEIGLCEQATAGSELASRDLSAIGSKTSAFSVDVTLDLRIARR